VVLVLVGGRSVLTFIYRPEYAAHVNLLFVMVVDASVTAASVFLGFAMTAARCFRSQIPIMVLNVTVTAALTLGLLPRYGLLGGGYALLISSTVQAGASYAVLRSAMSERRTAI
jgi:O-antigen/teichoic acid export membrane protein